MQTLTEQFGRLLKGRRQQQDLSQDALAGISGVSRSIISRLESGASKAVQTDVLDRIFNALGSGLVIANEPHPDSERLLARLEHQVKLSERRNRHMRLAVSLAIEPKKALRLVRQARRQVLLWRNRSLCSELYIERWTQLLCLSPREIARAMTELGDWEDAMFQNSPWAGAWK